MGILKQKLGSMFLFVFSHFHFNAWVLDFGINIMLTFIKWHILTFFNRKYILTLTFIFSFSKHLVSTLAFILVYAFNFLRERWVRKTKNKKNTWTKIYHYIKEMILVTWDVHLINKFRRLGYDHILDLLLANVLMAKIRKNNLKNWIHLNPTLMKLYNQKTLFQHICNT